MNQLDINLEAMIKTFLEEDLGNGDHTSLACIPEGAKGKAKVILKEKAVVAGLFLIEPIFKYLDPETKVTLLQNEGDLCSPYTDLAIVEGRTRTLLSGERLMLNLIQRMSGIATKTNMLQKLINPYGAKLLDTRKTVPGLRLLDKKAVAIGGGTNHRIGLYDMIMIKDNHVDYAGGIGPAINNCLNYLDENALDIKIEVEARNLEEVKEIMEFPEVFRILLDNFTPEKMEEAVRFIAGKKETEASGGITEVNITEYARTGVNYISVGALTHSVKCTDISFKSVL
ncbi:carboxylating nicotinate-nucleotide diphosphorylase [Luteibaculum oceani]|uniref:Probable nicotinate-nucleotide pyrophosphorylase [carboxylating] n=1 Tax=Luteibaculum oceani TaxID=1294296 RepID=A0A5C6V9Q3_9FLAO|nr:carboxylating nicotinate-nucleotide diphosphorylase [Luteibaculum oceani]TXC81520.1 carboxylating nicotinate-nucleotide diphosphorylase [Luteibaculum oceani]